MISCTICRLRRRRHPRGTIRLPGWFFSSRALWRGYFGPGATRAFRLSSYVLLRFHELRGQVQGRVEGDRGCRVFARDDQGPQPVKLLCIRHREMMTEDDCRRNVCACVNTSLSARCKECTFSCSIQLAFVRNRNILPGSKSMRTLGARSEVSNASTSVLRKNVAQGCKAQGLLALFR